MHVLVCPTAFKETLTAAEAAAAMAAGAARARPDARVTTLPLSDGGPGLLDALRVTAGEIRRLPGAGPMGEPLAAATLWPSPDEVVLEAASTCGLHLVPADRRDPKRTATHGLGLLLAACADAGARRAVVGLGGSGTVDGGAGLAAALGWRLLDTQERDLPPGGGALPRLARLVPPPSPRPLPRVTALADVRSPLLGPDGAARRFAPQKGASPADVEFLERGLGSLAREFARVAHAAQPGRAPAPDPALEPGAGAAGGLGFGLVAFAGADLVDGAEWVLERTGFDAALARADLVVTGEGAWDPTSDLGKITARVLERAAAAGVPAVLACGRIEGPVPEGVRAVDGGGRRLDGDGLARIVEAAVRP
ncbi:MAG: glycerate kinase [Gemmatimonadota bacterium]|nr:glycerate kinase [Gemmatimonadota bacterium]